MTEVEKLIENLEFWDLGTLPCYRITSKTCILCLDSHFLRDGYFYHDAKSKDGYKSVCIDCATEREERLLLEKEETPEVVEVNNIDNNSLVVTGKQVAKVAGVINVEEWIANGGEIEIIPPVPAKKKNNRRKKKKKNRFNPNEAKKNDWLVPSIKHLLETRDRVNFVNFVKENRLPDLCVIGRAENSYIKCKFISAPDFFRKTQELQISINGSQFDEYYAQCVASGDRYFYAFYIANDEKVYFIDIMELKKIRVDHTNLETDIDNKLGTDSELRFYDIKLIKRYAEVTEKLSRPDGMKMVKTPDGKTRGYLSDPVRQSPF
jgi:hypothetical protein